MRDGWLEVVMIAGDSMKKPFAEEEVPAGSGNIYTIVRPDDEYCVAVNIYRNRTGKFPADLMRVGLYVDGHDVNYWKRVDTLSVARNSPHVTALFWGFKQSGNDLRQFKIAKATPSSSTSRSSEQISSVGGKIVAIVHAAELAEGVYNNIGKQISVPKEVDVNGNQKFFTLPSAVTVGGKSSTDREEFLPVSRWKNSSHIPIATMTLCYHTIEMISVIKDLESSTDKAASIDIIAGTREEAGGETAADSSRKRPREHTNNGKERGDEDEVEIVPMQKIVPLLDLSSDDASPIWTTRTVSRS